MSDRPELEKGYALTEEPRVAPRWVRSSGVVAWCFIGVVVALGIVVSAHSVVSGVALPLVLAAVLAVIFEPGARRIERFGVRPAPAAGIVVLGLLAVAVGVIVITVEGVVDQAGSIGDNITAALDRISVDADTAEQIRSDIEALVPAVGPVSCTGCWRPLVRSSRWLSP